MSIILSGQLVGVITIGASTIPPGDTLAELTIRHGRFAPDDPPESSTCSIVLRGDWPKTLNVGDEISIDLEDGTPRFRGQVSDLSLDYVSTTEADLTVTGAGNIARISRRKVGYGDWPAETWSARVDRLMSEADWASYVIDTPLPTYLVAARTGEETTVNAQLAELATTGAAAICDQPDGSILFQPLEARKPQLTDPPPSPSPPISWSTRRFGRNPSRSST
jgi:hypothetical protein